MPNSDYQRHSFLGGEVSPSLYERADMEKFGKWFAKAENIRFRETGAFRNRCGFVKVADTKFNLTGEKIKLISFAFNDEESFLVELGAGYARFYRNGQPIMNGDEPYELDTPFTEFSEDDLKYAQAGDTVFITHPQFGIYELARLQSDGSSWEFKKFNTYILPMKEENEDKTKTVSLATYSPQVKTLSLLNPVSSIYKNVVVTFDNNVIYQAETSSMDDIANGIKTALSLYDVTLSGTNLLIRNKQSEETIPDLSISFVAEGDIDYSVSDYYRTPGDQRTATATVSYADFASLSSVFVQAKVSDPIRFSGTKNIAAGSIAESLELARGYGAYVYRPGSYSDGITYDTTNQTMSYNCQRRPQAYTQGAYNAWITLYGKRHVVNNYNYTATTFSSSLTNLYELTATGWDFNKLHNNDTILVKHAIDQQSLNGNYGTGTHTLGPVRSDGNWRAYNLGNWAGKVQIQYSTDNQATWVDYYSWASEDQNQPYNNSTSGSLTTTDLVWFRVVLTVTSGTIRFFFTANSFEVNSYYKILFKDSDTQAIVECIKNDVGLFTNNFQWRLPAFSNAEGWPQTVAFYQNRLFFGKGYIIYGSRNNDFWDFYEPIKLQADDPVTMSLLSQKVNTIRNLVTQRSFFTFTAGGEFGIGSEGALTQNDKYLKPFSANGSAPCLPVLISDKVLFVDKSYNSIRALQYSLEADGYEAPDITLTLRSLLENERIISTDIIYEEKEALFLSDTGTIWVLKYITDQNVLSWSHWKHAAGKITNICVVPHGAKHDLYIAVESGQNKWIEKMDASEYMDTVECFEATEDERVKVTGLPGETKFIIQGSKYYSVTVDEDGYVEAPADTSAGFKVGSVYTSTATLLAPIVQLSEYHHGNYEVKRPFKVFFYYLNSFGFKVGVEEAEKMEIEWQPIGADIDDEFNLTSGKKSVLIPSRFEESARVSFVQNRPFPMEVVDTLIQTDYGGK